MAIGIVGVGMLLGVDAGGGAEALVGGMFIILAALGYAVAAWYLKRNLRRRRARRDGGRHPGRGRAR